MLWLSFHFRTSTEQCEAETEYAEIGLEIHHEKQLRPFCKSKWVEITPIYDVLPTLKLGPTWDVDLQGTS